MKKTKERQPKQKQKRPWLIAGAMLGIVAFTGCMGNNLVFGTGTKFGLDISQRSDQQPEVTFGYQRAEFVSIPLSKSKRVKGNASDDADAYSVLGTFSVSFDPRIFSLQGKKNFEIKSVTNIVSGAEVITKQTNAISLPVWGNAGVHVNDIFATGVAAKYAATNTNFGAFFGSNLVVIAKEKAKEK